MKKTKRKILVARGVRKELMLDYNCCSKTVWNALNFTGVGDLATKIRRDAIIKYSAKTVGIRRASVLKSLEGEA